MMRRRKTWTRPKEPEGRGDRRRQQADRIRRGRIRGSRVGAEAAAHFVTRSGLMIVYFAGADGAGFGLGAVDEPGPLPGNFSGAGTPGPVFGSSVGPVSS